MEVYSGYGNIPVIGIKSLLHEFVNIDFDLVVIGYVYHKLLLQQGNDIFGRRQEIP